VTEQRTPLTLEYAPDSPEEELEAGLRPVIVIEPSFKYAGMIYIGVHPFGKRLGCHILPADAERVRNHLSKLLMDANDAPAEGDPETQRSVDWSQRIEQAAERAVKRPTRRRRKPFLFRFEFALGRVQGVIGTEAQ
jgi:hypothetical protein